MARYEDNAGFDVFGTDPVPDVSTVLAETRGEQPEAPYNVSLTPQGHQLITYANGQQRVAVPTTDLRSQYRSPERTTPAKPLFFRVEETDDGSVHAAWHPDLSQRAGDIVNQVMGNDSNLAVGYTQRYGDQPAIAGKVSRERDGTNVSLTSVVRHSKVLKLAAYTLGAAVITSLVYNTISGIGAGNDEFVDYKHPTHMFDAPAGDAEWVYHKINWLPGMH